MNKGMLVVISGPSGGGKGTAVKALRELMPTIGLSISVTTRAPREGEADGREYYFINRDDFEDMVAQGEILEHTSYCGNYYGTPKKEAERITGAGQDLILEIEVDGAAQIKSKFPDAVCIMLIPPTLSELKKRLRGRGTENEETVSRRIVRAAEEIRLACDYDYIVVNGSGDIAGTAQRLAEIIHAEHMRVPRMKDTIDNFLNK